MRRSAACATRTCATRGPGVTGASIDGGDRRIVHGRADCGAITDIAGSSGWFDRGFVTYSDEAKVEMLALHETLNATVRSARRQPQQWRRAPRQQQRSARRGRYRHCQPEQRLRRKAGGDGLFRLGPEGVASTTTRHFPGDRGRCDWRR
jgi:hypothetical protein